MIEIPEDPVEVLIQRVKAGARFIALTLMDEQPIISVGESMKIIPSIGEPITIYFERLESEPTPRRKVAQQLRRSKERTHKRLVDGMTILCLSLYAARCV